MIDGYRMAKIAAALATFTVVGLGRRNFWLFMSGACAVVCMIVSWHYGYRLSATIDSALQICAFMFALVTLILWIRLIYHQQRSEAD
jgi:hypothetical protein